MRRLRKHYAFCAVIILAVMIGLLNPVNAPADNRPDPALLPDYDIRDHLISTSAAPATLAPRPLGTISAIIPDLGPIKDLRVRLNPVTGVPNRIYSTTQPLTGASAAPVTEIARGFLTENRSLFNLMPQDIAPLGFTRNFMTKHNGVTHLTMQQEVNGIPVFDGHMHVNIDNQGRVLGISGQLIPDVESSINIQVPVVAEPYAVNLAMVSSRVIMPRRATADRLMYFPLEEGNTRLAWDVTVEDAQSPDVYQILVDAEDGTLLLRRNHTQYQHGSVYTSDSPVPDTPRGTSPCTGATYPACALARADMPFDGTGFFAAADGHFNWWNDSTGEADTATTKSNYAHAKEDSDSDDDDTEGFPTVTGGNFTFTVDLTQDPTTEDATVQNRSAAIANAFYWVNRIHHIYYSFGFDEAAGNFQNDNFGLGGVGGDAVQVDVQDTAKTCNAGFWSRHDDGIQPRMTLFLCGNATPRRDAGFENLIVIHEYTHGLTKRLVEVGSYDTQSGGLQDGLCDFMGLAITAEPGDDLSESYPRGQWYYNNVNGNRRQPYSTDKTVFTRTYGDLNDGAYCAGNGTRSCTNTADCVPPATAVDEGPCIEDPWPAGEIWCNTLWMARANLVWKHGFATGGPLMMQLIIDGLKNAPTRPDYLDMRDSILQADAVNNAAANRCILWDGFAKMGMGDSASSTGDRDVDPVEAFDVPADCIPDVQVDAALDFGNVCVGSTQSRNLRISNAGSGDLIIQRIVKTGSEDITVEPVPTSPLFIVAGAHADFSVRCAPMSCTSRTATVQIETNDPDTPLVERTFTCSGDEIQPQITCPADAVVECSQSTDPSHTGTSTATDNCTPSPAVSFADAVTPGTLCPQQSTITRTWTAIDGCGNLSSCVQNIQVVDTTPPVIQHVTAAPNILWSPNHKMVQIAVSAAATDNCDTAPSCAITGVSSNEPVDGLGDGDTSPDWIITGNLTVDLRAERSGTGDGRSYTLSVTCTDACGNSSVGNTTVAVPHAQKKK